MTTGGAPRVTVVPGGQSFHVEGAESILECALRAGLAVAYGCSSGNCGECKARVIQGRIQPLRRHDYRLTEAEKLRGYALMCCATASTDLIIEAEIAHGAAEMPRRTLLAHARRLDRLSDDVRLLELGTPRGNRLRFLAGQSAVLALGGTAATLPIASCPCEERRLHFHVRRIPGNPLSDYVFGRLRIGEAVTVEGPVGDFVLREGGARRLVFVVWGWEGFAPVKSVIEHALAQERAESIALYWISASAADHYHSKLCRSWADALDDFHYAPLVAGAGLGDAAATGTAEALHNALTGFGDLTQHDFYVAGPSGPVAASRDFLIGRGLAPEHLVTWIPA